MDANFNKLKRIWNIIYFDKRLKSGVLAFLSTTTLIVFYEHAHSWLYIIYHAALLYTAIHSCFRLKNYKVYFL